MQKLFSFDGRFSVYADKFGAQFQASTLQFAFFFFTFPIFMSSSNGLLKRSIEMRDICLLILSAGCSGFNVAACSTIILSVLGLKRDDWDENYQITFTFYVAIIVFTVKIFFVLVAVWYRKFYNPMLSKEKEEYWHLSNITTIKEKPTEDSYLPSSIWKSIFILSSHHDLETSNIEEFPLTYCSVTTHNCQVDCVTHSRPHRKKSKVDSHSSRTLKSKFVNNLTMSEDIDEDKLFILFQVCKSWRIVVYELVSRLFNSKLNGNSSWGLKILRHFSNIIALNLSFNRYFTDDNLRCLRSITSLNLNHNTKITNAGIIHLQNLKCLSLAYNQNITNDVFTFLTNLTSLDLSGNKIISDNGIKHLTSLISLDLSFNEVITDSGLIHLNNLQHLNLFCNKKITYRTTKSLSIS